MPLPPVFDDLDKLCSVISGLVAVASLVYSVWLARRTDQGRRSLSVAVRDLLAAQRLAAEDSGYEPWQVIQPPISDIYVEQQAEAADAKLPLSGSNVFGVDEMLERFRDTIVIGGPGTGKSTLAKNLVRLSADDWLTPAGLRRRPAAGHRPLTVRVPAARLGETTGSTMADALHEYFTATGLDLPPETFRQRAVRRADWLIIIDGTDEVQSPATRTRLLNLIRTELAGESRALRLIVTSRAPLETAVTGATQVRLRVFDEARLERFAERWFAARPGADPSVDARRYLTRVSVGPLAYLVRVPLMAAMTAVIYQFDGRAQLPTSRTELYAQFVDVVRRSRADGRRVETDELVLWLRSETDDLLVRLASHSLRSGQNGLLAAAEKHCAAAAPESVRLRLVTAAGRAALYDLLLMTSLFTTDGTDLAFLHYSVAEFLAAAPATDGVHQHIDELIDPERRSFALFCLARTGQAAEAVRTLASQRPPDPVRAGHLLVDGTAVEPGLQGLVVEQLGRLLIDESCAVGDVLTILGGLAVHKPSVADRLAAWAESAEVTPWARVLVADRFADIDPGRGRKALRALAADRGPLLGHPCRQWAAHRLVSRGDPMGEHLLAGHEIWQERLARAAGREPAEHDIAGNPLAGEAFRLIALDSRVSSEVRVRAALDVDVRDPAMVDVFTSFSLDRSAPADLRLGSAAVICRQSGPAGLSTIDAILRDPAAPDDTKSVAAEALSTRMDGDVGTVTRALLRDGMVSATTKRAILEQVQWRGNVRLSLEVVLDRSADAQVRTDAARFLHRHGGCSDAMRALSIDRSAPGAARRFAVDAMAASGGPENLALLRQIATDRHDDQRLRFCAATGLRDCADPVGEIALLALADEKPRDTWLAGALDRALHPPSPRPRATPASNKPIWPVPPPVSDLLRPPPPPADDETLDLARLRRIVRRRSADVERRQAAAADLLRHGDREVLDWLIRTAGIGRNRWWLRPLIVAALIGRSDPESVEGCRAMLADHTLGDDLRGRLVVHLTGAGDPAAFALARPLATAAGTDPRLRAILVDGLLDRGGPEDLEALVRVASAPYGHELTNHITEELLRRGKHDAVRALWPFLADARCRLEVRLALAQTLAYAGTRADLDAVGRVAANASTPPALRLRIAVILDQRGEIMGRTVLRVLTGDNSAGAEARAAALAKITAAPAPADVEAVRHLASDHDAPRDLRGAALEALAVAGPAGYGTIRDVGFDPANPAAIREQAGRILAQLGCEIGLDILRRIRPSRVTAWARRR